MQPSTAHIHSRVPSRTLKDGMKATTEIYEEKKNEVDRHSRIQGYDPDNLINRTSNIKTISITLIASKTLVSFFIKL